MNNPNDECIVLEIYQIDSNDLTFKYTTEPYSAATSFPPTVHGSLS